MEVEAFDDLTPEAMLQRGQRRPFFLLVEPDESDLDRDPKAVLREYWRLLFHARIHETLDDLVDGASADGGRDPEADTSDRRGGIRRDPVGAVTRAAPSASDE